MADKTLREAAQLALDVLDSLHESVWTPYLDDAKADLAAALALPDESTWIEMHLPEDGQLIEGKCSVDGPVWTEEWDTSEPFGAIYFWRPKPNSI